MSERTDEGTQERGKTLKRRGILAAAGATVAALVAKQATQPVAAASGGGDQGAFVLGSNHFLIAPGNPVNTPNVSSVATVLEASPNYGNYTGTAGFHVLKIDATTAGSTFVNGIVALGTGGGNGVYGISDTGYGLYGDTKGGAGVYGNSTTGTGVYGYSISGTGVFGYSGSGAGLYGGSNSGNGIYGYSYNNHAIVGALFVPANSGFAAVYGSGSNGNFGVLGDGGAGTGIGVQGQSNAAGGTGVKGISGAGFPIIGSVVGTGSGSNTAAGVLGAGTSGPGVQGQSTGGHGLVGTTDDAGGHAGLIGNATHTGGVGLMGIAPNYGQATVGKAGDFYGNVKINGGTLMAPSVQTVVPHAGDNTYRALHTVASPEGWFEDFGEGTLAGGKADVKLDGDFAALVDTSTLHVFLTPHTPQHLHVPERTATGFSVVATASRTTTVGGPKRPEGMGTFSYRVVAKRKDIGSERLAKVAAPSGPKVPTAFTIPETRVTKTPDVKPPEVKSPAVKP